MWEYLQRRKDNTIAFACWHRRAGKDDVGLHYVACAAMQGTPGAYWHCLPEYGQARKSIWNALDSSGQRRIDRAFPKEIRAATRNNDMMIEFKSGSTFQVVGSDNYDSLVGSNVKHVTFSEWALAKPQAWAYIRPILAENGGTALFITTPRGNNHAARMYRALKDAPNAFVQMLTAHDTSVFTEDRLKEERAAYIAEYGASLGENLYQQEYLCSFDAALVGSIFGKELRQAENRKQIGTVHYDPKKLVYTSWDLGEGDATSCWFFQVDGNQFNYIDYYECNREKTSHYLAMLRARGYDYDTCLLPHDAEHSRMNADQTVAGQFRANGFAVEVIPQTPKKLQIAAGSNRIAAARFDKDKCEAGLDGLKNYRWNFNKTLNETTSTPVHDWASHPADAFMCGALSVSKEIKPLEPIEYSNVGIV